MNAQTIMTLDRWLKGRENRTYNTSEMTSTFANCKPSKQFTARLIQSKKTVSIGVGPNRQAAISDAIHNLPSTYR